MDNDTWIDKAKKLYESGKKYYQIANELGVNRKTVSIKLRELGYQSDQRYVRKIDTNKLRKSKGSIVKSS